ncbi:primosomal protein N' [Campylobacter sp. JMF_08 NE1]|uniref:primosomal protein N' n=1 Tax=Campylobacter sp. JMF_08 NE1 TaxID=2983821 RepID=UPI003FA4AEE9
MSRISLYYYEIAVLGARLKPLTYFSNSQISPYQIVQIPVKNAQKRGVILREVPKPEFCTKEITEILPLNFTPFQVELAQFISHFYICEIGVAFGVFEPNSSINCAPCEKLNFTKTPNLTPEQTKALNFAKQNAVSLIFGDTGSGKSEVYISLIAEILNSGKQALFLMPEISLTPQMTKRLQGYFGEALGVWHSKITPAKKRQILADFFAGKIRLIAGARSALFLPFHNLGAIIVDEEHDDSYKSASAPRINARDLAIFAAHKCGVKTVLGSATPSLTSFAKQPNFRLKGTYHATHKRYIYDESETSLTPKIKKEISASLGANRQVVVFLPTRANFKYMVCKSCGEIIKCPFCSVGMSYHEKEKALKCHYCGYSAFYKQPCAKCGKSVSEAKKMGTSELLKELKANFPEAKIAKFDRDEITTQRKLETLLNDFNAHKIDILVGTQMLSKGHDYHGVDLAVIMGIDEHLNYPDFRAREKTLALGMQVAGRAGRKGEGRVVIQTLQRAFFEDFLQDYDAFLEEESEDRDPLYPPYTRLLRVLISHKNEAEAAKICASGLEILHSALKAKKLANLQIIGHGKAGIALIAGKFRYEILLRATTHTPLLKAGALLAHLPVEIDMDPINFS